MGIDLGVSAALDDLGRYQRSSGSPGRATPGTDPPMLTVAPPPCPLLSPALTYLSCECVLVVLEGVDGLCQPHVHTADDILRTRRAPELVSDKHHRVWQRC